MRRTLWSLDHVRRFYVQHTDDEPPPIPRQWWIRLGGERVCLPMPDGDEATPQPWEPGTLPTVDQLAEWLVACSEVERLWACEVILHNAETAVECIQHRHHARLERRQHG